MHNLSRFRRDHRECGPQYYTTLFRSLECRAKLFNLQQAADAVSPGTTVGRRSRMKLLKEPKPLLREREWERSAAIYGNDRARNCPILLSLNHFYSRRQLA